MGFNFSENSFTVSAATEKFLCDRLLDQNQPISERFRALFSLRNLRGPRPRSALIAATRENSNLLAHEAAFALGQMQDSDAVPALEAVLNDLSLHPIVRHEAAEALGAIGSDTNVPLLKKSLTSDPAQEVRETCELALSRIEEQKKVQNCDGESMVESSPFLSIDPAAPASCSSIDELREVLLDEEKSMYQRYSALFALRNHGGDKSITAIIDSLGAKSALLRHEVLLSQICACSCTFEPVYRIVANVKNVTIDHGNGNQLAVAQLAIVAVKHPTQNQLAMSGEAVHVHSLVLDDLRPARRDVNKGSITLGSQPDKMHLRDKQRCNQSRVLSESLPKTSSHTMLKYPIQNQLAMSREAAQAHVLVLEVAYVLGQLQNKTASAALSMILKDINEHPMVRHEAAEALGSIADDQCVALLEEFAKDPEPIVSESCEVALSMLEFERSGKSFEYLFMQAPQAEEVSS